MSLIQTKTVSPVHALLTGVGFLLLVPGAGHASTYGEACNAELNMVEMAINNSVFLGQKAETDRSNLINKLSAADAKIILEKYSDAIDKLSDISDTATKLANASKPKLADATAINEATTSAISCVAELP